MISSLVKLPLYHTLHLILSIIGAVSIFSACTLATATVDLDGGVSAIKTQFQPQ